MANRTMHETAGFDPLVPPQAHPRQGPPPPQPTNSAPDRLQLIAGVTGGVAFIFFVVAILVAIALLVLGLFAALWLFEWWVTSDACLLRC